MTLKFDKEVFKSFEWQDCYGLTFQNITETALHHDVIVYKRSLRYRGSNMQWMTRSVLYSLDLKTWFKDIIEIHRALKKMGL